MVAGLGFGVSVPFSFSCRDFFSFEALFPRHEPRINIDHNPNPKTLQTLDQSPELYAVIWVWVGRLTASKNFQATYAAEPVASRKRVKPKGSAALSQASRRFPLLRGRGAGLVLASALCRWFGVFSVLRAKPRRSLHSLFPQPLPAPRRKPPQFCQCRQCCLKPGARVTSARHPF